MEKFKDTAEGDFVIIDIYKDELHNCFIFNISHKSDKSIVFKYKYTLDYNINYYRILCTEPNYTSAIII